MPTRREFLKTSLVAGTALALFRGSEGKIWAYAQSPKLRKFVAPLPGLGPTGIPVATPATNSAWPGADFYQLSAQQYTQQMHPDLPIRRTCGATSIPLPASPPILGRSSWRKGASRW